MYTKSRARTPQHDATPTHTNAVLHHATTTRLDYTRAVAQEVIIREVYKDVYPIPTTFPISTDTLTVLADKLTMRACYNCDRCMDATQDIQCGTPFTPQEVLHLIFIRLSRGQRFG